MRLNRRTVNAMRYVLEDLIPPALRDSRLFFPLMRVVFGRNARKFGDFRRDLLHMSKEEYSWYYKTMVPVMGETDLNRACLEAILRDVEGESVLDVGCGRGFLALSIAERHPDKRIVGLDIEPPETSDAVEFVSGWVEDLPFGDDAFDTVVCTHTLEHILNVEQAVSELRRVARQRLIIVVPREREYLYTFNFHVNFFPYQHSFLNRVRPLPEHRCTVLDGDIYFVEGGVAEAPRPPL
jgi:SAM-dependent methyltransferase